MSTYEELATYYNLSTKYKKISFEEEKELILEYQSPNCPQDRKSEILQLFWDMHKNRVVKFAIRFYNSQKSTASFTNTVELNDLIMKGFFAIPHCLDLWGKPKIKKNDTKTTYKAKVKAAQNVRFGTLLEWWIRPMICNTFQKENQLIYTSIPTKKQQQLTINKNGEQTKKYTTPVFVPLQALSGKKDAFEPTDNIDAHKEVQEEMFWEEVKKLISKPQFALIKDYCSFDSVKQLSVKYNLPVKEINNQLRVIFKILQQHKEILKNYK